jgi:hypothetical protein
VRQAVLDVGGTIHPVVGRPTYGDFFRHANQHFAGQIVILANADIRFNETLLALRSLDWENRFLALTRSDFLGTHGEGSSDVWMFRSPLPLFGQNVTFGTVYCDQVVSFLAGKQGLRVDNPCLSVECEHVHHSEVRNRPGTCEHRREESTSTDGLEGQTVSELEKRLVEAHGLRLMAFSRFGGGMVWPSKLVVRGGPASPERLDCRVVPRWQPMRRVLKQGRRALKSGIRRVFPFNGRRRQAETPALG